MTRERRRQGPAEHEESASERHYESAVSPFVERFAADLTEAGMQRMSSRIFACLLASEEGALSSAQLAERLRVSPAAISGAVRYLSQVRMVSREREPGSRRERYRVHHDVWFEAITSRDTLLHRWTATLRTGVEAVGADSAAGRRIEESVEFLDFVANEMIGLRERWLKHRAEREADGPAPGGPLGSEADGQGGTGADGR